MGGKRLGTVLYVCISVAVSLALLPHPARGEHEWSGYVNFLGNAVDFVCPDNLAVVGVASDFRYETVLPRGRGSQVAHLWL